MIHVGEHRVEPSDVSMTRTKLHIDTVDIHDVDSLYDLLSRLIQFQSVSDELDSVFLVIIPHFNIVQLLLLTVACEARE